METKRPNKHAHESAHKSAHQPAQKESATDNCSRISLHTSAKPERGTATVSHPAPTPDPGVWPAPLWINTGRLKSKLVGRFTGGLGGLMSRLMGGLTGNLMGGLIVAMGDLTHKLDCQHIA